MASYSLQANDVSQSTPKLPKGTISMISDVPVFWIVGENPTATDKCALLLAHDVRILKLPVGCSRIAILAVDVPGPISISEINGTKASCSA